MRARLLPSFKRAMVTGWLQVTLSPLTNSPSKRGSALTAAASSQARAACLNCAWGASTPLLLPRFRSRSPTEQRASPAPRSTTQPLPVPSLRTTSTITSVNANSTMFLASSTGKRCASTSTANSWLLSRSASVTDAASTTKTSSSAVAVENTEATLSRCIGRAMWDKLVYARNRVFAQRARLGFGALKSRLRSTARSSTSRPT